MLVASSELVWIPDSLGDYSSFLFPGPLIYDRVAYWIVSNPFFYDCTKHLDVDCQYVKDRVLEGFLRIVQVCLQVAYIFTKVLPAH